MPGWALVERKAGFVCANPVKKLIDLQKIATCGPTRRSVDPALPSMRLSWFGGWVRTGINLDDAVPNDFGIGRSCGDCRRRRVSNEVVVKVLSDL
jgi:hypothetical protein